MSDIKDAKRGIGSVFPEKVVDSSPGVPRVEPLITPNLLKKRFLFGVPLTSPITQEKITNKDLQDYISRGVARIEMEAQIDVFPVLRRHKAPFIREAYTEYMFIEFPNKPIQKINKISITSANYEGTASEYDQYPSGGDIFRFPTDWIEPANMNRGLINIVPLNPAFSSIGYTAAASGTGAALLTFMTNLGWIPAFFLVECVTGLCSEEGNVPVYVNEAIGAATAIKVLDNLIPQYRITSSSLGIDGLSQSVGDQMYQLLTQKRADLEESLKTIVNRLKTFTSNSIFSGNV